MDVKCRFCQGRAFLARRSDPLMGSALCVRLSTRKKNFSSQFDPTLLGSPALERGNGPALHNQIETMIDLMLVGGPLLSGLLD